MKKRRLTGRVIRGGGNVNEAKGGDKTGRVGRRRLLGMLGAGGSAALLPRVLAPADSPVGPASGSRANISLAAVPGLQRFRRAASTTILGDRLPARLSGSADREWQHQRIRRLVRCNSQCAELVVDRFEHHRQLFHDYRRWWQLHRYSERRSGPRHLYRGHRGGQRRLHMRQPGDDVHSLYHPPVGFPDQATQCTVAFTCADVQALHEGGSQDQGERG